MASSIAANTDAEAQAVAVLAEQALAWAAANGLMAGVRGEAAAFRHIPVSLCPATMPAGAFQQALDLAPLFGLLVDRIVREGTWLADVLRPAAAGDEFTAQLLRIFEAVGAEGVAQPLQLGLLRSDYMVDAALGQPLQVELNTIASSFAALSARTTRLHRFLLSRWGHLYAQAGLLAEGTVPDSTRVPDNAAVDTLADGIAAAHSAYLARCAPADPSATCVVFVVQEGETNVVDQRALEHRLWEAHRVPVTRATLAQLADRGRLAEDSRAFHIEAQEVSVLYFRAGYAPQDYPTDMHWSVRHTLERSRAIKCPSIGYHLAGAKRVQQALALPGMVERFASAEEAAQLRACFAGQWALDGTDDETAAAVQAALRSPLDYVLKPQREGGGNNLYGAELRAALETLPPRVRAAYILMQRIKPARQRVVMMRMGEVALGWGVSELGVYSALLTAADGEALHHGCGGHLVRTKLEHVDEGGVAAGFAVLDSPYLTK